MRKSRFAGPAQEDAPSIEEAEEEAEEEDHLEEESEEEDQSIEASVARELASLKQARLGGRRRGSEGDETGDALGSKEDVKGKLAAPKPRFVSVETKVECGASFFLFPTTSPLLSNCRCSVVHCYLMAL